MSIAPTDIIAVPRGVRVHQDKIRNSIVLLAPERAITLDPIGQAILDAIDGERDFESLTQFLAKKYQAPVAQISEDCAGFIRSLLDRRILEIKA